MINLYTQKVAKHIIISDALNNASVLDLKKANQDTMYLYLLSKLTVVGSSRSFQ